MFTTSIFTSRHMLCGMLLSASCTMLTSCQPQAKEANSNNASGNVTQPASPTLEDDAGRIRNEGKSTVPTTPDNQNR